MIRAKTPSTTRILKSPTHLTLSRHLSLLIHTTTSWPIDNASRQYHSHILNTSTPILCNSFSNQLKRHESTTTSNGGINNKSFELEEIHPLPVRSEFLSYSLNTKQLEDLDIGVGKHRKPQTIGDWFAWGFVRFLRPFSDLFFRQKYVHRAVTLETVAAVPGMVASMTRHLTSLRKMRHDGGWIDHLLKEASNERMHLMIWMKVCQPSFMERLLVGITQYGFTAIFSFMYIFTPSVAHRFVGYLEEEAVVSYTHFLHAIDQGNINNLPAPSIAIDYYNLPEDARLRDVVLCVRADEANHRDVNHYFSDRIVAQVENLRAPYKPRKQQVRETDKPVNKDIADIKRVDITVSP